MTEYLTEFGFVTDTVHNNLPSAKVISSDITPTALLGFVPIEVFNRTVSVSSGTTPGRGDIDPGFGTHIRETVRIFRDWINAR